MRRISAIIVALVLAGCTGISSKQAPVDVLSHDIKIPAKYRGGDPWPGFDGSSKRYCYAYESGWWTCIEMFAGDPDREVTASDKAGNGWPSEVDGYWAGYSDAEKRVRAIIREKGKNQAQEIFRKALQSPNS